MAASMYATISLFLKEKRIPLNGRVAFMVSCTFEIFFPFVDFPKDPQTVAVERLLLKAKFIHGLNRCRVTAAAISDCLNDNISVNYP